LKKIDFMLIYIKKSTYAVFLIEKYLNKLVYPINAVKRECILCPLGSQKKHPQ